MKFKFGNSPLSPLSPKMTMMLTYSAVIIGVGITLYITKMWPFVKKENPPVVTPKPKVTYSKPKVLSGGMGALPPTATPTPTRTPTATPTTTPGLKLV